MRFSFVTPALFPVTPAASFVTPAKAGVQHYALPRGQRLMSPQTRLYAWIPAFAGMTGRGAEGRGEGAVDA